jgi:glutaconate CoA-transferase subunit A
MEVLAEGTGEYKPPRPDEMREWVRLHKQRRPVDKVMTEQEAVSRFVADGDYVAYDMNVAHEDLLADAEIIRQPRRTCG